MSSALLSTLSQVYGAGSQLKNFLYESGFADSLVLNTPVVSIGNLTVGGTGKTPITQMIIDYYTEKSVSAAIVGRNYKAKLRGTAQVDPNRKLAAQYFGDEPTLLAMKNPHVGVFVGPRKWVAAHQAETLMKPDVIVIDDGFQHRALHRDLDLVLMDVTVPLEDYELLPAGRAREPMSSLDRADYILLTKTNLVGEEKLEAIKAKIPSHLKVIEVAYRLGGQMQEAGTKALAFAGLARPESFRTSIQQDTLYELLDFVPFPDHHKFTREDIDELLAKKNAIGADVLLLTEKDWVKVRDLVGHSPGFRVLELKTHFLGSVEELYASLDKVVRKNN